MVNPSQYAYDGNLQANGVSYLVNEFADELMKMSGKCMDVGCGPGNVTKDILLPALDENTEVIGTDISEKMIKHANMVYREDKSLNFDVLDIQTKNLPKKYIGDFDNIFSFYTLQWCNDIQQAFENIYRMLRPGGTMLIVMVPSHPTFEIFQILMKDSRFSSYLQDAKKCISAYQDVAQPQEHVKRLLKDIGFDIYHCSYRDNVSVIKSTESFLSSILSVYTYLDKIPFNRREEFKSAYVREYMKRNITYKLMNDDQEQVLHIYKSVIIYAQKIQ